jgi:hypothetical protein
VVALDIVLRVLLLQDLDACCLSVLSEMTSRVFAVAEVCIVLIYIEYDIFANVGESACGRRWIQYFNGQNELWSQILDL